MKRPQTSLRGLLLLFFIAFAWPAAHPLFSTEREELEAEAAAFLTSALPSKPVIERLLPSFSNRNYLLSSGSGRWVFRLPNELSNLLAERFQERDLLLWAKERGLSLLEVFACDPERGFLLTAFLSEGSPCRSADFKNEALLRRALGLLKELHREGSAPMRSSFDPLSRFRATLKRASEAGIALPDELLSTALRLEGLLASADPLLFRLLPCHNDPSPENFFQAGNALYLHDWELAALNDPMWDLAHLAALAELEPENILSLYRPQEPLALEKLSFFRPFILFNTAVWASFEKEQASPAFPRKQCLLLYKRFLQEADRLLDSSAFLESYNKLTKKEPS